MDCVLTHPKVIHVRNALDEPSQRMLVDELSTMKEGNTAIPYRYGFEKLGVIKAEEPAFDAWKQRFGLVVEAAQKQLPQAEWLDAQGPVVAEVLGYHEGGKLVPHVDYVPGFAVIFTFGAETTYFFRETSRGKEETSLVVCSGDAVIFPTHGGPGEPNVWHGIREFGDTPKWFSFEPYQRCSVQLRQTAEHLK